MVQIKVKLLDSRARMPFKATEGAVGYDLCSIDEVMIYRNEVLRIGTGVAIEIPEGYVVDIRPRSGLAARDGVIGVYGTIDIDYRGEIGVILHCTGEPYHVQVGERIAQMVILVAPLTELLQVDQLSGTDRGAGGFGSTGKFEEDRAA